MALNSELLRKTYSGNGTTLSFTFPFYFLDATDLDVYLVDQAGSVLGTAGAEFLQTFVTQYDVIGAYSPITGENNDFSAGATITFVTAPASGYTIVILRNNPDTQDASLVNTTFPVTVIEQALDKIVMMVQYLSDKASRSVRMTDANPQTFNPVIPNPIVASSVLAVDPTGTSIIMGPNVSTIAAAAASSVSAAASASAASASASTASTSATNASSSATAAASSATSAANSAAAIAGTGGINETVFNFTNNQSVAANVTGLSFNPSTIRSAFIDIQFYINTTGGGATEYSAMARYLATYKTVAASWDLSVVGAGGDIEPITGQPAGVTISITSLGQVQYTSTNVTGTAASSVMHFKASTMGV